MQCILSLYLWVLCLAITWEWRWLESPKLTGVLPVSICKLWTSFEVKRSRSQIYIMLRLEMSNNLRTDDLTNFKYGWTTDYVTYYKCQRQGQKVNLMLCIAAPAWLIAQGWNDRESSSLVHRSIASMTQPSSNMVVVYHWNTVATKKSIQGHLIDSHVA